MVSKPLLKQSVKANKIIWLLVTLATCIMLASIIVIMGSAGVSQIRDSLTGVFVKNVVNTEIDKNSMNSYYLVNTSIQTYNQTYTGLIPLGIGSETTKVKNAYDEQIALSPEEKDAIIAKVITEYNPSELVLDSLKDYGVTEEIWKIFMSDALKNYAYATAASEQTADFMAKQAFVLVLSQQVYEQVLAQGGENPSVEEANNAQQLVYTGVMTYVRQADAGMVGTDEASVATFTENFVASTLSVQMHAIFVESGYEFSEEYINNRSKKAIDNFRAQLAYREIDTTNSTEVQALIDELCVSLFDEMPTDVANSLRDLGDLDIYGLVVGNIFFRMAGLLLPFVFIIMCSNNLLAGQVDTGAMAYVLSTPTKRRKVAFTQAVYLVMSLLIMFLLTTIVSVIALNCVNSSTVTMNTSQILLFNLGAFLTTFAISGICFLASACFNRSKNAMGVGGGISMFFLVTTILGMFGSEIIPAVVRIDSMNFFNYLSIITLFDAVSILNGTLTYLWKFAILVVIGIITYTIGIERFNKKDLPL